MLGNDFYHLTALLRLIILLQNLVFRLKFRRMKAATKKQFVQDVLDSIRDFIWVEDLYLLIRQKGASISISTVRDTIDDLERSGHIAFQLKGRKTFVKII